MAQYQLLLLCLILAAAYVSETMAADEKAQTIEHPSSAPTPSPSMIRKLGKHHLSDSRSSNAPALSPSSAPASENQVPVDEESVSILEQKIHLKKNHHSLDRSVAGGGVILGGLATTFLVAVFCYIRATARHKAAETTGAQISS